MGRFDHIRTQADMSVGLNTLDREKIRRISIQLNPDAAAVANVQAASTPANGESVTIDDGEGNNEVFEFTDGGGLTVGTIEVDKSATTTGGMAELKAAIGASALNITDGAVAGVGPWDLPLTHNTQAASSNTATIATDAASLTLTAWAGGIDGNLNAAAASQTIPFPEAIPAGAVVVAAAVQVDTDVSGGTVSAATADIGDVADPDKYIAAEDVFGSGGGGTLLQGSPGAAFTGLAGMPVNPGEIIPDVVISTTGGDVADLDAGRLTAIIWFASPPAA